MYEDGWMNEWMVVVGFVGWFVGLAGRLVGWLFDGYYNFLFSSIKRVEGA